MSDPVSWLVVERGWSVLTADATEIGRVEEVLGDRNADIFDGLAVATGAFDARYVASEYVADIREGEVRLALEREAAERLRKYEGAPPSERLRPDDVR